MPEDWGGDTVMVPISALKREGISDLLEMILLTADILELKANPDIAAQGAVLEARKEVGRGIVVHRAGAERHAAGSATCSSPAPPGAACAR